MIQTLTNRRIETNSFKRLLFDLIIVDLKDILSCYDKAYHYKVIMAYLNIHCKGLSNTIKGRILYIFGQLFY
jgi:hypothetical protein